MNTKEKFTRIEVLSEINRQLNKIIFLNKLEIDKIYESFTVNEIVS